MTKIWGFPGQGSQFKGMGGLLFEKYPDLVNKADMILGYSIKDLCLYDPDNKLSNTRYSQPAIYVVSVLSFIDRLNKEDEPDYLIGHSLGEFSALYAAGVFDFETGLQLVQKRAELMSEESDGAMAAIIGLEYSDLENILKNHNFLGVDFANFNTKTQIVLSGLREDIDRLEKFFEHEESVNFIKLNVSGAFHSKIMVGANEKFADYMKLFRFNPPIRNIISSIDGKLYEDDLIENKLSTQMISPVRWYTAILSVLKKDIKSSFVQIGPGNVVEKLWNQIIEENHSEQSSINMDCEDNNNFENIVEDWNRLYKIGTKIRVNGLSRIQKTRSEAVMLFDTKPIIYLEGYKGYFEVKDIIEVIDDVH
ncbi:ACP S-malonyltransferase [Streptococcus mutans]|uniref:ACP S-malonyltransferase n=1 Tax=Streptococcus mutans TaxID=1309 RepID=UPI0038B6CD35